MRTRPLVETGIKDYFDSLDDFISYADTSPKVSPPLSNRKLNYRNPSLRKSSESELMITHDYKGGYQEKHDSRCYTFGYWHLTDKYVYFSHHMISLPPRDWISTAHSFGCSILGTIILEHNTIEQLIRLISDDVIMDLLVKNCKELNFDGYLLNFELRVPTEDIHLLINWIQRFTLKMSKSNKIVIWYDAVTIQGNLHYQNRLSPLNVPFLQATCGIFLNYFWSPHYILESTQLLNSVNQKNQNSNLTTNQLYFGIDVFGRGQYGGGGFESWRALDVILKNQDNLTNLSVALFAPGWTHEGIDHNLDTREAHRKWKEDDNYFWIGGKETIKVVEQQKIRVDDRKTSRGLQRVRQLALAIGSGRRAKMDDFNYHATFPQFPEAKAKPISSYFSAHPLTINDTFYTNFASGSGHDFYLEGNRVHASTNGWTDVAFHYFPANQATSSASIYEDDAWNGPCSLLVEVEKESGIPLCSISIEGIKNSTFTATVVWKQLSGSSALEIRLQPLSSTSDASKTTQLDNEWLSTTTIFQISTSTLIKSFDIQVAAQSKLLIGSLHLTKTINSPVSKISNLTFDSSHLLRWSNTGPYLYYTIWIDSPTSVSGEIEFLGTSLDNEFDVGKVFAGETIFVRGVLEDGSLEGWSLAECIEVEMK